MIGVICTLKMPSTPTDLLLKFLSKKKEVSWTFGFVTAKATLVKSSMCLDNFPNNHHQNQNIDSFIFILSLSQQLTSFKVACSHWCKNVPIGLSPRPFQSDFFRSSKMYLNFSVLRSAFTCYIGNNLEILSTKLQNTVKSNLQISIFFNKQQYLGEEHFKRAKLFLTLHGSGFPQTHKMQHF